MRALLVLSLLALAACSTTAPTPPEEPAPIQCRDAAGTKIPCP
jgi:ABC-type Fe3+-hydroxamate transport system substrate-binding protein